MRRVAQGVNKEEWRRRKISSFGVQGRKEGAAGLSAGYGVVQLGCEGKLPHNFLVKGRELPYNFLVKERKLPRKFLVKGRELPLNVGVILEHLDDKDDYTPLAMKVRVAHLILRRRRTFCSPSSNKSQVGFATGAGLRLRSCDVHIGDRADDPGRCSHRHKWMLLLCGLRSKFRVFIYSAPTTLGLVFIYWTAYSIYSYKYYFVKLLFKALGILLASRESEVFVSCYEVNIKACIHSFFT
ncbi:Glycerol-3-phosphate dehydrogenase [NAD(P)+] [Striga asiatica]|uniref:Glycerol-3-phosphate dehydrogenase [NAD(P)+] n=1 Tax=Striga asiatica TaxID=4170 RepID=A0A5A7PWR3_STRAF|nr:Glycerol-3-phosphate dehydrogenase [NAD(P)+] [Striga asiatica]